MIRRTIRRIGFFAAYAFLIYLTAIIVLRPIHRRWGATDAEIAAPLPGDRPGLYAGTNHAITIDAPPSEVWKWLVQIGQDRAGFYSYDVLENLVGADIHNVYEIRPEWQSRKLGDFIRSATPEFMGGRYADLTGWRVTAIEPNSYMVLENWGAFVLRPAGAEKTRMIIRTNVGKSNFWLSLASYLVFDPAHFIMERRMLIGIKECAEKSYSESKGLASIEASPMHETE